MDNDESYCKAARWIEKKGRSKQEGKEQEEQEQEEGWEEKEAIPLLEVVLGITVGKDSWTECGS